MGDKAEGVLPVEESIARFEGVSDLGRTYGVTLAQENVVRFRASDNAYIAAMRRQLGPKAAFVFDLKQCRRCGHRPEDVVAAMGSALVHVHISDNDARRDCLPPAKARWTTTACSACWPPSASTAPSSWSCIAPISSGNPSWPTPNVCWRMPFPA